MKKRSVSGPIQASKALDLYTATLDASLDWVYSAILESAAGGHGSCTAIPADLSKAQQDRLRTLGYSVSLTKYPEEPSLITIRWALNIQE